MELIGLAILGGVLALDGTSVGQFMVSRPLAAGVLTGWLLGDVALGGAVGAILELYLLVSYPTGGSSFPEGSTATVVAVAVAAAVSGPGALPVAVGFGLVWGQLGGATVTLHRRLNTRLALDPATDAPDTRPGSTVRRLTRGHWWAIARDWVRGAALTLVGVLVGRVLATVIVERWPLGSASSSGLLLVGGAVSAGILLGDLGGFRRRRIWLAAGLALGILGGRFL